MIYSLSVTKPPRAYHNVIHSFSTRLLSINRIHYSFNVVSYYKLILTRLGYVIVYQRLSTQLELADTYGHTHYELEPHRKARPMMLVEKTT